MDLKALTIICGHYGTGKTNLAVNLAMDAAREGRKVTIIDMDIVNPYFRTSDHKDALESMGIRVVTPTFANSNVEMMTVPPEAADAFGDGTVIVDVGGDDAGATVLGRYKEHIDNIDHDMWYVINRYRSMVSDVDSSVRMLHEIESSSRIKATGIVNNSHLKEDTTTQMVLGSMDFARKTSEAAEIPVIFTTCPRDMMGALEDAGTLYPVDIHVRTPWEEE